MSSFHENASFGSHDYDALGGNRGLLCPFEKPKIDLRCKLILAAPAIFFSGGKLEKFLGQSLQDSLLQHAIPVR